MGFFRREKPLHERLAEEAGIVLPDDPMEQAEGLRGGAERAVWAADGIAGIPTLTNSSHPLYDATAIHGIPRNREWDAVASAQAPELPGDQAEFVALPDGTLFTDDDLPDDSLTPLADALDGMLEAPYHALARRQEGEVWAVAAVRVNVLEVPEEIPGDKIDLAVNDGERTVLVDEVESRLDLPTLEEFAAERFGSFVLRASRLDDTLWEVTVLPL